MSQLVQTPSFWQGIARKEVGFSVTTEQLEIRLTNTPHDPSWTKRTNAGFVAAVVPNNFADESLVISASAIDIGGEGGYDSVLTDKDFTSVGAPTGPFQYIYLVDVSANWILGYFDLGSPQTLAADEILEVRTSDASDRIFAISN